MTPRTPEDCDALFARCVNGGDLDGLVSLYEPAATLVQQDGSSATGHDAIRQALAPLVGAKATIRMNVTRVIRAGDDLAVLYNDWTGTIGGPDGAVEMTGRAMEVVRRQPDGSWRFAVDDPWAR
jgi:uncharacterized protein (TIGR02246 family)